MYIIDGPVIGSSASQKLGLLTRRNRPPSFHLVLLPAPPPPIPILPFRRFILTWSEPFTPLPSSPSLSCCLSSRTPSLSLSLSPIDRLTMYRGGLSRVSISRIRSLPMPARSPPIASPLFFYLLYQFDLIKGERRSSLSMNFSLYELKLSSTY